MNRSIVLIVAALFMILSHSCVKEVSLNVNERPMVAVECILTDGAEQTLRINFTEGSTIQGDEAALEATIATLEDLTAENEAGTFRKEDDGLWHLSYSGIPGHKYQLGIRVEGYEFISACTTMPDPTAIKTVLISPTQPYSTYDDDPLVEEGYVQTYHDDQGKIRMRKVQYGTYLNIETLPEVCLLRLLDDRGAFVGKLCTDFPGTDKSNISEDFFESALYTVRRKDMAYMATTSTIADTTHIGFISYVYPLLQGKSMYEDFLLLEKSKSGGKKYFTVSGHPYLTARKAEITSFAGEYADYIRDAEQINARKESTDLTEIYNRFNSYSNIENGIGLFSSCTKQVIDITQPYSQWEDIDESSYNLNKCRTGSYSKQEWEALWK